MKFEWRLFLAVLIYIGFIVLTILKWVDFDWFLRTWYLFGIIYMTFQLLNFKPRINEENKSEVRNDES